MHVIDGNSPDLCREVVESLLYITQLASECPIGLGLDFVCHGAKQDSETMNEYE